jgi:hypothetical protein
MVVSNTTAAIFEINEDRMNPIFTLNSETISLLLNAVNSCSEWCETILFDALSPYQTHIHLIDRCCSSASGRSPHAVPSEFAARASPPTRPRSSTRTTRRGGCCCASSRGARDRGAADVAVGNRAEPALRIGARTADARDRLPAEAAATPEGEIGPDAFRERFAADCAAAAIAVDNAEVGRHARASSSLAGTQTAYTRASRSAPKTLFGAIEASARVPFGQK